MVHRSKELAPVVLLANVPLWNNCLPEAEPKIRALNARFEEIGRSQAVPVLPLHETLEDPEGPGRMKPVWTPEETTHRSRAIAGSASSPSACPRGSAASRRR